MFEVCSFSYKVGNDQLIKSTKGTVFILPVYDANIWFIFECTETKKVRQSTELSDCPFNLRNWNRFVLFVMISTRIYLKLAL
jgi:hypothetical protein